MGDYDVEALETGLESLLYFQVFSNSHSFETGAERRAHVATSTGHNTKGQSPSLVFIKKAFAFSRIYIYTPTRVHANLSWSSLARIKPSY